MSRPVLAFTALLLTAGAIAGQGQRVFTVDGRSVVRPIAIPGGIIKLLEDDPGVRPILDSNGLRRLPAVWVTGSMISVSTQGSLCFLILGQGALLGANTAPFWVFSQGPKGEYKALFSTLALRFEILNSMANGYREIQTAGAFADRVVTLT